MEGVEEETRSFLRFTPFGVKYLSFLNLIFSSNPGDNCIALSKYGEVGERNESLRLVGFRYCRCC